MAKSIKLDVESKTTDTTLFISVVGETAEEVTTEAKNTIKLMKESEQ